MKQKDKRLSHLETISTLFESLEEWKDQTAILAFQTQGLRSISYAELASNIDRLSKGILKAGISKDDHAVLLANNRPEWIMACLAAMKAGAIVVPLDVQLDDQTTTNILKSINPKIIFTTSSRASNLEGSSPSIVLLDKDDDEKSWMRLLTEDRLDCPVSEPNDIAAIFYTSGTMAAPKGVPLTQANLSYQINSLLSLELVKTHDRIIEPLPFHHIYPFTVGMLCLLASGATIIMPESLTGPQLVRAMQEGEATAVIGVPRLYSALYDAIMSGIKLRLGPLPATFVKWLTTNCSLIRQRLGINIGHLLLYPITHRVGKHLRILACGGAPLEADLASQLEGLGWQLAIGYGLTETSPLLTIRMPGKGSFKAVGKPLPGTEIYIDPAPWTKKYAESKQQNADDDRLTEKGSRDSASEPMDYLANSRSTEKLQISENVVVGEILARGPGVFSGYLNLPKKNAETITKDGWFRTGDLGYMVDGELYVLGRISTLIVTPAGKKIDPEELENHYSTNPSIKEIGVLQRSARLVAVVVPDMEEVHRRGGWELDRIIRDGIDERSLHLPSHKRLSGYAISNEPIARTAMGKIKRYKLEEQYDLLLHGKKDHRGQDVQKLSDSDRQLLEHSAVKKAWEYFESRFGEKNLSLDTSPQLDLGVDSLEWLGISLDIRRCCGVELDDSAIAGINNIRELLAEVAKRSETTSQTAYSDPLLEPEKNISDEQKRWLSPPNLLIRILQLIFYGLFYTLAKGLFRLKVVGLENISASQHYVFTPNHASFLDPFVLAAALPFQRLLKTHWAGWTGIAFANFFVKFLSRIAQAIPIDADKALISSLSLSASVLKQNKSLIWFPEGRRTLTGELLPFKGGLGLLLTHYDVLVVPVLLKGTANALPPGSRMLRPAQVTIIFGKPVGAEQLEREGKGADANERILNALQRRVQNLDPQKQVTHAAT